MSMNCQIKMFALSDVPIIKPGDDLTSIFQKSLIQSELDLQDQDVVVVAQKVVSIAEGRVIPLNSVTPSKKAEEFAKKTGRDPRYCQLVIDNSREILYLNQRAIITEDNLGLVNTSAGIDRSNSGSKEGEVAILLPIDPDASARCIRNGIIEQLKKRVAVIISDSCGRPFRKGSVGMAIGIAGIASLEIDNPIDLSGRQIHTEEARVDELAAAASMLMGQAAEQRPFVIIRGARYTPVEQDNIQNLLRPPKEDQVW